jgi:hypothetical protein
MYRADFSTTAAIPVVDPIPRTIDAIAANGIGPEDSLCPLGPALCQPHSRPI